MHTQDAIMSSQQCETSLRSQVVCLFCMEKMSVCTVALAGTAERRKPLPILAEQEAVCCISSSAGTALDVTLNTSSHPYIHLAETQETVFELQISPFTND